MSSVIKYVHNDIEYDVYVNKELLCKSSLMFKFLFDTYKVPKIYSHSNINNDIFMEFLTLMEKMINNDNLLPHDYIKNNYKLIKCDETFDKHCKNICKIYADINFHKDYYLHIDLAKIGQYIMIANVYYIDVLKSKLLNYVSKILINDPVLCNTTIEYYYCKTHDDILKIKEYMCKSLVITLNKLLETNEVKIVSSDHSVTNIREDFVSSIKIIKPTKRINEYYDLKIVNKQINSDLTNRLKKQLNVWYDIIPWDNETIVFTGGLLVDIIQNYISSDYKDIDLFLIGTDDDKQKTIRTVIDNLKNTDHEIYYNKSIVQIIIKDNKRCLQLICTSCPDGKTVTNLFDASHLKMFYNNHELMISTDCIYALVKKISKIYEYRPIRVAKARHAGFEIECPFGCDSEPDDIAKYFEMIKNEHKIDHRSIKCNDLETMFNDIKYNGEFENYAFLSIVDSSEFDTKLMDFSGPCNNVFDPDYVYAFIMYKYYGQRNKRLYVSSNEINVNKIRAVKKDNILINLNDNNNNVLVNIFKRMDDYFANHIRNLIIDENDKKYMRNASYNYSILQDDNTIRVKFIKYNKELNKDSDSSSQSNDEHHICNNFSATSVFVNDNKKKVMIDDFEKLNELINKSTHVKVIIEVAWLQGLLSSNKKRNYEMVLRLKHIYIYGYSGNEDLLEKVPDDDDDCYDYDDGLVLSKFPRTNELDERTIGFLDKVYNDEEFYDMINIIYDRK